MSNSVAGHRRAEPAEGQILSPEESAGQAGLRYVYDEGPGIRRQARADGFHYLLPDGRPLTEPAELARIRRLAIPPAWSDVWICPLSQGHLQATGRDARGRKQYRYHPEWRAVRDQTKYEHMLAFARALPAIRARTSHDLSLPGLPRAKVLATVVRLLEVSHIRVGNAEYARQNRSFGLTTMRVRHVEISGAAVRFRFRGKSGKQHDVVVHDRRLTRVIQRCHDLPGYELFQYLDDEGMRHAIDAGDVNAYLNEITGCEFTAKDFRTWQGTVLAALALSALTPFASEAEAKHNVVQAVEQVATQLGNTPAVCRSCYIHPAVLEAYHEGALSQAALDVARSTGPRRAAEPLELEPDEAAVLRLLCHRLEFGGTSGDRKSA